MMRFGSVPVPFSVSWTAENETMVAPCGFAGGRLAICQSTLR